MSKPRNGMIIINRQRQVEVVVVHRKKHLHIQEDTVVAMYMWKHQKNSFKGEQPGIGAVLGTRTKNISKKVPFDIFFEKLGNYILREVTNT